MSESMRSKGKGAGRVPANFSLLREVVAIERKQQVADQLEVAYRVSQGGPVQISQALTVVILRYLRSHP